MFLPKKSGTKAESSSVQLYTEVASIPLPAAASMNTLPVAFATSCNITLTTPPVSQKIYRDTASLLLSSCDRETDILSDDFDADLMKEEEINKTSEKDEVMEVDATNDMTTDVGFHKPFAPMDDPLLMDDIAKSISALDDVIALFDDTSLPYLNDDEVLLNCNELREEPSSKVLHTSDFHRVQEDITNCNRFTSQFSTELGPSNDQIYSNKFLLSHSSSTASSSASSTSSGGVHKKGRPPRGGGESVGGTYSKATSFQVTREEEQVGSAVKSSRPQLSRGVFSSREPEVPEEPEVDYFNDGEDSPGNNNNNGAHSSCGSGGSSSGRVVLSGGSKEEWNFPSEKNLPRSLRKTRKTCLMEEEEGRTVEGESQSSSSCSHSTASRSERNGVASKVSEETPLMVAAPRKSVRAPSDNNSHASYSSSSSLSFNSSSEGKDCGGGGEVVVVPKPRARQQVPSSGTPPPPTVTSVGGSKVPQPNPKPVAPKELPPTPLSLEVEMSRVGVKTPEVKGRSSSGKGKGSLGGSGSSISRSSSSSSGGDPNFFCSTRKEVLSSSSGVVLTSTSSSAGSPTHSAPLAPSNLLRREDHVTVISTGGGDVVRRRGVSSTLLGGLDTNKKVLLGGVNGGGGVLEVDDGYLSMINRNEAPLLWPEEFIENETFSPDELRRLSVHLGGTEYEETDEEVDESRRRRKGGEIELEIVEYEREPSRRSPVGVPQPSRRSNKNKSTVVEKTDYFSDDSLEGESEASLEGREEVFGRRGRKTGGGGVSRIPKMVGGSGGGGGALAREEERRKACSFFVSLSEGGEVTTTTKEAEGSSFRSSSLPKGSRVGEGGGGKSRAANTDSNLRVANAERKGGSRIPVVCSNPRSEGVVRKPTAKQSSLPQLRHTKSINVGGPRGGGVGGPVGGEAANLRDANKRKSTSDLVEEERTSSFNRSGTFLIPSRKAEVAEEDAGGVVGGKGDDETDNDEEDLSVDLEEPAEEPFLQHVPLSIDELRDFVSEIMDTAIRHRLTQTDLTPDDDTPNHHTNTLELLTTNHTKPQSTENGGDDEELSLEEDDSKEEKVLLAEQFEAVVTNFLSDNESFLQKEEEEEVEEEAEEAVGEDEKSESQDDVHLATCSAVLSSADDATKPEAFEGGKFGALRDSSLVGEESIVEEGEEEIEEELPPAFIPTPPPKLPATPPPPHEEAESRAPVVHLPPTPTPPLPTILPPSMQNKSYLAETRFGKKVNNNTSTHLLHHHNSNVREGKAALDLLAERISNSKKFSSPDEQQLAVSHFVHDKRNIWGWYDRPYEYDEELLTVNSGGGRGFASRSQENLVDAMTKERFQKSFSTRGQSSTLPLNCRPPTTQRRSSTFRNMFNKFRRNKGTESSMKEIGEYHGDDEVQSITSRETGASETSKKRGFFSRLFRRSKKH